MNDKKRLVVGISGASGVILGIELLKILKGIPGWETHAVITRMAEKTIAFETDYSVSGVLSLADYAYDAGDLSAAIASGTFTTQGMAIVPCSMKTVAGVACGYSENLLLRAADVTLKEKRRLVIAARECPLSALHLKNMLTLAEMGAVIMPPMLGFYNRPQSIEDITNHIAGKILACFGIDHVFKRWGE